MNSEIKSELLNIVGKEGITESPEDLVVYSYDAYTEEHKPDLVLFPATTGQVSDVMKVASREHIPVTARGSGTNIAGQTIPVEGGIVLVLSRMDRILSIDKLNRIAVVEPGVINYDLQLAAASHGLMYPPDPASWMAATIGGNVATNAGGPRTVKYGVTRDYLLGLTVVLADGTIVAPDRNARNTGFQYDLVDLMCGSEGTLGIVTGVRVRLIPKPAHSRTLRADFQNLDDCGNAVAAIISEGMVPTALELMDRGIAEAVESVTKMGLPTDVEGILLIELDGEKESLDDQVARIEELLRNCSATGVLSSKTREEADSMWRARRAAFSAMASLRPNSVTEDATVPVTSLAHMIRKTGEIAEKHDLHIGVLAHAGDGNLHPLILFDQRDPDEVKRVHAASEEIFREALAVGGTISGEHGIGMAKTPYLSMQMDPVALAVTRGIKKALDPLGILNPGKFV
jgi:glycolate dehydrogenase FAD-linked subunit